MLDAYRTPDRLKARIALHERFGNTTFDLHQWLFDLVLGTDGSSGLQVPAAANVLEVGSGTGRMWQVAGGRVPPGWSVTLTDRSEGMLHELRRLAQGSNLNATVAMADASDLPFEDATFDLAFANHMLYHVPQPERAMAELRRVLKPGGALVAATNGAGHMRQATDLARPLTQLAGVGLTGIDPLSFTCESGTEQLGRHFERVELHRHDDQLTVTDAGALLDYLRSLVHLADDVPHATTAALQTWEAHVRAVPLPFVVERATGVFVARSQ